MNNPIMPADNAALSANTVDVQDLCSLGMDRAIGIEKKKTSWFAPVGKLFKAAAQTIGFCMEMRRKWLALLAPHALSHVSTVASNSSSQSQPSPDELAYSMDIALGPQHVSAPRGTAVISSVRKVQPQPTSDDLAYSMDIALGPQRVSAPRGTAVISSVRKAQPQPTPDELAYSMDIAIGERFTAAPSTVDHQASTVEHQAPTTAEAPENNREIAIAARAGG